MQPIRTGIEKDSWVRKSINECLEQNRASNEWAKLMESVFLATGVRSKEIQVAGKWTGWLFEPVIKETAIVISIADGNGYNKS